MTSGLEERVALGAATLDAAWARDGGWAGKIDGERLDLADPCDCVLGQLYGSYAYGLSGLNISGAALVYGFTGSPALGDFEDQVPELRRLWVGEIERRLA